MTLLKNAESATFFDIQFKNLRILHSVLTFQMMWAFEKGHLVREVKSIEEKHNI